MSLPELIEAHDVPTGNAVPSGIITALKSRVSNILTYVVPTTNVGTNIGDISYIVNWNGEFQTVDNFEAYVQVEFKERYVFATHYSLKGCGNNGWWFAKGWYLYGFDSVGETPTLITTNTSEGSTFCGTGNFCNSLDWGTFAIPNPNRSYRFFRLKVKEPSYSSYSNSSTAGWRVALAGIEVFGVYSNDIKYTSYPTKRTTFRLKSCPVSPRYSIPIIFKAILFCSSD